MSTPEGSIILTENRFKQLINKETKLDAILAMYPEIAEGQKLTPAAKRYKAAFAEFVKRVDEVLSSKEFVGMFQIAYVHGFVYKGPDLAPDIAAAKKLLEK